MARLMNLEYDNVGNIVNVTIADDGEYIHLEEPPRWISVKDRLPTSSEDVLVLIGRDIDIGYYEPNYDYWVAYVCIENNVTHWMPLPELPEEVQNERNDS